MRVEYLRATVDQTGFLPSAVLVVVFYAFLRAVRRSMWRIALLALPGTIAHELMHLVLQARPRAFSIWPRRNSNDWSSARSPSVTSAFSTVRSSRSLRSCLLPVAWLRLVHVLVPVWAEDRWGWWLVGGYLAATTLFALPSFQDLRVGAPSLPLYVAVVVLLRRPYTYV